MPIFAHAIAFWARMPHRGAPQQAVGDSPRAPELDLLQMGAHLCLGLLMTGLLPKRNPTASGEKKNTQRCLHSICRRWMPIFVYAFAVTGLAAALLTLSAIAVEGARQGRAGPGGSFGWAADTHYLPKILYLAIVPGILGHQGEEPREG
jgi:hypothetical protein